MYFNQAPIILNTWKHSLIYIRSQIQFFRLFPKNYPQDLLQGFQKIGESQFDLYTGGLDPVSIIKEVASQLSELNLIEHSQYQEWIGTQRHNYRNLQLPDQSKWILRNGNHPQNYIHLHPARYSQHSIRIKGTALKTAIAVKIQAKNEMQLFDVEFVNQVRRDLLNLSPLRQLNSDTGTGKALLLLTATPAF